MENGQMQELFFKAVLSLENDKECKSFFKEVCTDKEIAIMSQRIAVAKLLLEGKPYSEIVELTGVSTAIVSRVNRTMSSGCKKIIKRVAK